jgi:hypothetical protein
MRDSEGGGDNDVALVRISNPVDVKPASLSDKYYAETGNVLTYIGYGNGMQKTYGTQQNGAGNPKVLLKNGDSGGGVFLGELGDNGPLVGVMSNTDGEAGRPSLFKERIAQRIRDLEGGLEPGWARPSLYAARLRTDYFPNTSSDARKNARECGVRCTKEKLCRSFSYSHIGRACLLNKFVSYPIPSNDSYSGLPFAAVENMKFDGNPIAKFSSRVYGLEKDECHAACALNFSCAGWTIWREKNMLGGWKYECRLYDANATMTPASADYRSSYRRDRDYDVNRIYENRHLAIGEMLSPAAAKTVKNPWICALSCAANRDCRSYVYRNDTQTCEWGREFGKTTFHAAKGGAVSGTKKFIYNSEFTGKPFKTITFSSDVAHNGYACQAACAERDCVAWTQEWSLMYRYPDTCIKNDQMALKCRLYKEPGIHSRLYGAISGLKGSEFAAYQRD